MSAVSDPEPAPEVDLPPVTPLPDSPTADPRTDPSETAPANPRVADPPPLPGYRPNRLRRMLSGHLDIVSKVMVMLAVTGLTTALVVGFVAYRAGTTALRAAAYDNLRQVRQDNTIEIERYFEQLRDSMVIYTRGTTAIDAVNDFSTGFAALGDARISAKQHTSLQDYYRNDFVKKLDTESGERFDPSGFAPTGAAQQYLQAHYTAPFTDYDTAIKVDDAGDGSAWSAAHAKYHDYFRELVKGFHYEDALLINTTGTVVYSAYSGVDLGTNLNTGPYRGTKLAAAYADAMNSNEIDYVKFTDYELYQPAYGQPVIWAVTPIGANGKTAGVLALQLSRDTINSIMTNDGKWSSTGLGRTGESYLVGPDALMRSTSRLALKDPAQYRRDAIGAGLEPAKADRAARDRGTILIQSVDNPAVQRALAGRTGTTEATDYEGHLALMAYGPVSIPGLHWAIVAELDADEAFQPVNHFARDMVIATALLILLICTAALLLAQLFVRPLNRLSRGVRSVASGDLNARVAAHDRDEFGLLGLAFNDMAGSLQTKQDLIEVQRSENDELLHSLMPDAVARRYRDGEQSIAEEHHDVSVLYADLLGFEELTAQVGPTKALEQFSTLIRAFDQSALRHGVEKVRTIRTAYLASCGLVVPRVDNIRRAVIFARDLSVIIDRFNAQHGTRLGLRAGVDTGSVTSGLVGQSSVVYDMWGDAVNLALRIQGESLRPGVFVTARIYDRLRQAMTFSAAGTIDTPSGPQQVWRLEQAT